MSGEDGAADVSAAVASADDNITEKLRELLLTDRE